MTKIAKVTSGIVCANGPNAGHYVDARAIGYGGMIMLGTVMYQLGYVSRGNRCRPFLRVIGEPVDPQSAWDAAGLDHEVDAIKLDEV